MGSAGRRRTAALLCATILLGVPVRAADESGLWTDVRPFVEASRSQTLAVLLGRYMVAKRWGELLNETLFLVAPRGAWDDTHPAWAPARAALATAMRQASVEHLNGNLGEMIHDIVRDHAPSDPERARATAFYLTPGGRAFLDHRERFLRDKTYGLPFVVEPESRPTVARAAAAAKKTLLHLPDAQTTAVYEFNQSPLGESLMKVQNNIVAEAAANCMRSELDAIVIERFPALAKAVRAAVPKIPPPTDKTYLGTVTMRPDRTFDLTIEQYDMMRKSGTYPLSYAPDAVHWPDIAAGVPDMAPGQTRFLYVDPIGRMSDHP